MSTALQMFPQLADETAQRKERDRTLRRLMFDAINASCGGRGRQAQRCNVQLLEHYLLSGYIPPRYRGVARRTIDALETQGRSWTQRRFFRSGEAVRTVLETLSNHGPMTTTEVAERVADIKGVDDPDARTRLRGSVFTTLYTQRAAGEVAELERRGGEIVWVRT